MKTKVRCGLLIIFGLNLCVVISALAKSHHSDDEKDVQDTIDLLKHEKPIVRVAAAKALGKMGKAALDPLTVACQKDASPEVRAAAATSLGMLGPVAKKAVISCLKTEKHVTVLAALVTALDRVGSDENEKKPQTDNAAAQSGDEAKAKALREWQARVDSLAAKLQEKNKAVREAHENIKRIDARIQAQQVALGLDAGKDPGYRTLLDERERAVQAWDRAADEAQRGI